MVGDGGGHELSWVSGSHSREAETRAGRSELRMQGGEKEELFSQFVVFDLTSPFSNMLLCHATVGFKETLHET